MKKTLLLLFVYAFSLVKAQNIAIDSLADFDFGHFTNHYKSLKTADERTEFRTKVQRAYLKRKFNLEPSIPFFTAAKTSTSPCTNLDFEDGNTNNWTISGDFQVTSGSGTDPFGCFPVVCPGGNFSIRLNDNNVVSKTTFTASAFQTINITSLNSIIKINYAGCIENFPHPANSAAFFKIEFFDQSNNLIPSQSITAFFSSPPGSINAPSGSLNYISSTMGYNVGNQPFPVTVFPWQSQTFNLTSYIGQNIKLKLSADWCIYNYDWAYAYFDVCCSSSCPTPQSFSCGGNYCVSSFPNQLCGPTGMYNYLWTGTGGPVSYSSCATISTPGTYTLTYNTSATSTVPVSSTYSINTAPSVTFTMANTYCNSSSSSAMFVSPSGGTFSGPGTSGTNTAFNPSLAGNGTHTITYMYTDPNTGCNSAITQTTTVTMCTAVKEDLIKELNVYPNPFSNKIVINIQDTSEPTDFVLINMLGQEAIRKRLVSSKNTIDSENIPPGLYFYSLLTGNKQVASGKLVKE